LGQAEGVEALPVREKTAETRKKASQPKEETGRLWDQKTKGPRKRGRKKGANPDVSGALKLKTLERGTAQLRPSTLMKEFGMARFLSWETVALTASPRRFPGWKRRSEDW